MKKSIIALIITLVASGCAEENTGEQEFAKDTGAVLVSTARAKIHDLPIWLKTVGRARSKSAPTLAAEVSGRITQVTADTGAQIEKGQLLAEIDTSTLLLQKQSAQAGIERLGVHISNGERRVERLEKLAAKNLSSQTQLDDAREQLDAFRADLKAARAQLAIVIDSLSKSLIVAPVSGVIQQRMISTGDFVNRGQPLFEITRPDYLQAWLPYPESVALQIEITQTVEITSPLIPGESVMGEISELQPAIGLGSRAVMAIVDLENPGKLRPGATLTGKVLVDTRKATVMTPIMSIVRRPAGDTIYVINNNQAEARIVTTGSTDGTMVEIRSGLKGDELVATDGAAFLTDGATVSIKESLN